MLRGWRHAVEGLVATLRDVDVGEGFHLAGSLVTEDGAPSSDISLGIAS